MKKGIMVAILVIFFAQPVLAEIEFDSSLPNEAYGAKILSIGYRYNWKTKETEIRVKVRKDKKPFTLTFTKEHLPMGAALASRIGKKINLIKGTRQFSGLLIIGIIPNK
jgi:hypothetical protein